MVMRFKLLFLHGSDALLPFPISHFPSPNSRAPTHTLSSLSLSPCHIYNFEQELVNFKLFFSSFFPSLFALVSPCNLSQTHKYLMFTLKNMSISTFFGDREALFLVTMLPPLEKNLSTGTEVAGIARIFLAMRARLGKVLPKVFQNFRTSNWAASSFLGGQHGVRGTSPVLVCRQEPPIFERGSQ